MTTKTKVATCIGCGCDDHHACPLGCSWLKVDRAAGIGVCSECPGALARWRRRKRGAKALYKEPMKATLVTLDAATIKRGKKLGRGNLSAGIRKALA